MKHILIIFLLLQGVLFSCTKEEICYSCDPEVDAWVKENKESLTSISTSEIAQYKGARQSAIFRAMSVSKQQSLWLEKFDSILKNSESFSQKEKEHIRIVRDYIIDSNVFSNRGLEEEHHTYLNNWMGTGKRDFGWSDADLVYLLVTLYTTDEERASLIQFASNISTKEGLSREDCTCNTKISICNIAHECLDLGTCDKTNSGCGLFWSDECNGDCWVGAQ